MCQVSVWFKDAYYKGYVSKSITEAEVIRVSELFHNLLLAMPESSKFWLPIEELHNVLKQLANSNLVKDEEFLLERIQAILSLRDEAGKHAKQIKMNSQGWDNSELIRKLRLFLNGTKFVHHRGLV